MKGRIFAFLGGAFYSARCYQCSNLFEKNGYEGFLTDLIEVEDALVV